MKARYVMMIGAGSVLMVAGCEQAVAPPPLGEVMAPPAAEVGTTGSVRPPAARTARDLDQDGFISATEAAGFYARRFGSLDANADGMLSREELAAGLEGVDDPDAVFSEIDRDADELVSQGEYFEAGADRFRQRRNPNSGMVTTADFDTMVRFADPPAIDELDPQAEVLPELE